MTDFRTTHNRPIHVSACLADRHRADCKCLLTVRTLRWRAQAALSWTARCARCGRGAAARQEKTHATSDQQQRCRLRNRRRWDIAELQAEVPGPTRVAARQRADRGRGDQKIVAARLQGAWPVPVD